SGPPLGCLAEVRLSPFLGLPLQRERLRSLPEPRLRHLHGGLLDGRRGHVGRLLRGYRRLKLWGLFRKDRRWHFRGLLPNGRLHRSRGARVDLLPRRRIMLFQRRATSPPPPMLGFLRLIGL